MDWENFDKNEKAFVADSRVGQSCGQKDPSTLWHSANENMQLKVPQVGAHQEDMPLLVSCVIVEITGSWGVFKNASVASIGCFLQWFCTSFF